MATSSTDVPSGPRTTAQETPPTHLTPDDRVGLLRAMLSMRAIEQRAMNLYRQGKVPGSFYDGFGQEAVSVGATWAMAAADRLCVLHRDLGAHIVRGVQPSTILSQYMGRDAGVTSGRDGNVHFGDYRTGCVGMVSMLPDMMLVAAGMAMAFKLRGEARCALTWFGDGSTSRGDFHEAMNWAGVQNLPVIFVLENNQFAYSTPIDQQFAVNPVQRAAGYGFPGVSVDGNDAEAVFEATRAARERAIAGGGPTLIEAVTMRMHGHGAHDDMKYVPKALVDEWRKRDPIDRQSARVAQLGADVDALKAEVLAEVEEATKIALAGRDARPGDGDRRPLSPARGRRDPARGRRGAVERLQGVLAMTEMTYLRAISDGLRTEMRDDGRVLLMGEDIGVYGGAFKVTDGFIEEFGADRVMDTPLAESGIVGTAVGAAVVGLRPVCEMQFADFVSCGFDQIINVAGKMLYRQGLPVNITVRLPSGGGFSGGPFHSQNPEAWFMHSPGLKVVAPSTPEDAKGLIIAAIRDPNPVIYMEHKNLYRRVKGEVPEGSYETPFAARVAREGSDLVVITYGAMVHTALEATQDLEGASIMVLDLRSLVPLDEAAILAAVHECSKVVIVDEANQTCAAGAQVAALIAEHAFEDLDGPVVRVASPDIPIPFSPPLEAAVLPSVDRVREACRQLLEY